MVVKTNIKKNERDFSIADKQKISSINPWMIWFPAALFYCYQFILRVSPSVMEHDLMHDFGLEAAGLGALTAFYYYGYCSVQIPLGVLVDYFGPRKLLTFAVLLCASATAFFATSSDLYTASFARLLIGLGSSCAFLGCMKLGTLWFNAKRLPIITGATILLGTMGANFGGAPLRILANHYNWRTSLLFVAGFGILIGFAIWLLAKDKDEHKGSAQEKISILTGLKLAFSKPQVLLGAVYGFLLYTPLSVFADLWGASFLSAAYNITTEASSGYSNCIYIGLAIGALLYAWAVDKFITLTGGLRIATIGVAIPFSIMLFTPDLPLGVMGFLLFLVGVMIGGQFLSFAFTCSHMPVHFSGVTIGLTNMITMMSGVLFQPLVGEFLDLMWTGQTAADGVHIFDAASYRSALTLIPVCIMISFVISLFLKEGNAQSDRN